MSSTVKTHDYASLEAGFGDRLREQRKGLGLTQAAIAARLDVAVRSIKGYEAGSTSVASNVIYRMMSIGIDIGRLFYGNSLAAPSGSTPHIDQTALDRAIAWVDGDWGENGENERISDRERIEWILIAYSSIVGGTPEGKESLALNSVSQRTTESG